MQRAQHGMNFTRWYEMCPAIYGVGTAVIAIIAMAVLIWEVLP